MYSRHLTAFSEGHTEPYSLLLILFQESSDQSFLGHYLDELDDDEGTKITGSQISHVFQQNIWLDQLN